MNQRAETVSSTAFPRVAVVIPTFNRWPHVCTAIDSVLGQTYPNIECIVVDDASRDRSSELLASKYGGRIRLLTRAQNGEKSAARNDGIRAAQAVYVCMLDDDDLLTPDSVEARMRIFLQDSSFDGVAYGPVLRRQESAPQDPYCEPWPEGDVLEAYVERFFVHNSGYLISLANMLTQGMYREDLHHREEVELLIRLSARFEFRCCRVPVTRIRRVDVSSRSNHSQFLRQRDRFLDYVRTDLFVIQRLGNRLSVLEFKERRKIARACYRLGDFRAYRRIYLSLLRRWPRLTFREGRFLRRFLVSFVLQAVGYSSETVESRPIITRPLIADLLEGRRPAEIRRKPGRTIVHTTLPDSNGAYVGVFLKIHHCKGAWIAGHGGRSPASLERQNLEWAAAHGIPVPRLIGAADFSGRRLASWSVLATEELDGMSPLHVLVPKAAKKLSPTAFRKWMRGVGEETARLTALLHHASRFHRDLYLCHFFLPEAALTDGLPISGRLHLLDFLRLKHPRWNRKRWQVKDLAQLLYSSDLPGIGPRDRLRFMHAYLQCTKPDRDGRSLLKAVLRKAERYRRQNRDRVTG